MPDRPRPYQFEIGRSKYPAGPMTPMEERAARSPFFHQTRPGTTPPEEDLAPGWYELGNLEGGGTGLEGGGSGMSSTEDWEGLADRLIAGEGEPRERREQPGQREQRGGEAGYGAPGWYKPWETRDRWMSAMEEALPGMRAAEERWGAGASVGWYAPDGRYLGKSVRDAQGSGEERAYYYNPNYGKGRAY